MAIIYALKNRITGFVYIGCTSGNMAKRLREHRCLLRKKKHSVDSLQADWLKYGESAFVMEAVERFDCESVIHKRARELYWMQEYSIKKKLYNEGQQSFSFSKEAWKKGVDKSSRSDYRKSERYLSIRKEVMKRTFLTEENLAGNSERMKNRWSNPLFREKMKEAQDRGRQTTNARRKTKV